MCIMKIEFGPTEQVECETLDYCGYPATVNTEKEQWNLLGELKQKVPYVPYQLTVVPTFDSARISLQQDVKGQLCIASERNINTDRDMDRMISLATEAGASGIIIAGGNIMPTGPKFDIPVFTTTNRGLLLGQHRIRFRPTRAIEDSMRREEAAAQERATMHFLSMFKGDMKKKPPIKTSKASSGSSNSVGTSTPTTSPFRKWAEANGMDHDYVAQLEEQGVRTLEDFASLQVSQSIPASAAPSTASPVGTAPASSSSSTQQAPLSSLDDENVLSFNSFELEGVGGLSNQLDELFTRAFTTRMVPNSVIKEMGLQHVRGVILYGPPGTGKTLIARQIGTILDAKEVTVVSGPEILSKYFGESEERVRELFADAEEDQEKFGDKSKLHVIILDEMDAICSQRSDGTSTESGKTLDSVVNQILAKMDGVNQLNNILVIGLTNRVDTLDDALKRPGRFEVHIKIDLPDGAGRLEILNIHTKSMQENNRLGADVDLTRLAEQTRGMSGADLAGLVRSAGSLAIRRSLDGNMKIDPTGLQVLKSDFDGALKGRDIVTNGVEEPIVPKSSFSSDVWIAADSIPPNEGAKMAMESRMDNRQVWRTESNENGEENAKKPPSSVQQGGPINEMSTTATEEEAIESPAVFDQASSMNSPAQQTEHTPTGLQSRVLHSRELSAWMKFGQTRETVGMDPYVAARQSWETGRSSKRP